MSSTTELFYSSLVRPLKEREATAELNTLSPSLLLDKVITDNTRKATLRQNWERDTMNEQNLLIDAFYDEDYAFIKHVTGERPNNQEEAEDIINKYLRARGV